MEQSLADRYAAGERHLDEQLSRPKGSAKRTTTQTAAAIDDPVAVGKAARAYQASERKEGREISSTDAVAHIMGR